MLQSRLLRTAIAAILSFLLFAGFLTLPFAAIPVAAIGLAFGLAEAALVAAFVLLLTGILLTPTLAISFAILLILPVMWLVRMALLSRPMADGEPTGFAFYPADRLMLIAMAIVSVGTVFMHLSFLNISGGLTQALAEMIYQTPDIRQALEQVYNISTLEQINLVAKWMLISGFAIWPIMLLANLQLAQGAMVLMKRNLRPSPDYNGFTVPRVLLPILAVLLILGLALDGAIASLFLSLAAIALGGYFLLGLAVIHAISRHWKGRGVFLSALYFFLLMMAWVFIPVTLMGLLDMRFNFRGLTSTPDKPSNDNREKE